MSQSQDDIVTDGGYYETMDALAAEMCAMFPTFRRDWNAWDNSAWCGGRGVINDGWDEFNRNKYYEALADVLARYQSRYERRKAKLAHPCKFYLEGRCGFAERCKYAHEGPVRPTADKACHQFEQTGTCKFGARCKWSHATASSQDPQTIAHQIASSFRRVCN